MPSDKEESYDEERRRKENEEPLDHSPSSGPPGSTQKDFEASAPQSNDGRSETRTTFYAQEADNDEIDYRKLAKINDGHYFEGSEERRRRAEQRRDVDIITTKFGFNESQKERSLYLLSQVENGQRFESDQILALTIATIVANEDDWMIRQEDEFEELLDLCNADRGRIRKAREKLREYL